ncbi:B-cell receptor CD22-like [Xenentodon cancila]
MLRDFIQTSEELAVIEPERKPGEENIHYGEIKFSKRTPGPSSDSVQECRQELDSVYSQVQVSAPISNPEEWLLEQFEAMVLACPPSQWVFTPQVFRLFVRIQSHSDTYFFRIENEPFRATAECESLQITVKDSPWRPTINIPDDLKENERVTVTCSAVTPCPHSPPELTWNLQQDFHTQTEKNNDGTFTTKIQKNITLSDTHDGYNIRCSVRYPVNEGKHFKTSQTAKTLNVSYAPKDTSASISLVSEGSWVNLTCSSRANPPVSSFTWFKKSEDGDMKVAGGDFYILNVADGGVYYCVATNDVGNQTSAVIFRHIRGK